MKIDAIYHSVNDRRKERKGDRPAKKYSKDPVHHPLLLEREYVRALNATKVDRLLAKPFIAALCHGGEGINHLVKDYEQPFFATASYDNKTVLWDMNTKEKLSTRSYDSPIAGIALDGSQNMYVSQHKSVFRDDQEYRIRSAVSGIDLMQYSNDLAVSSSSDVQIFDIHRFTPKTTYAARDTTAVRFNHSFRHLMGGIAPEGVRLYDNRSCKAFATLDVAGMNCMEFNPQHGHVFALGNEDGNSYGYDIRNLEKPLETYRGHANAVVSLAFHPNGREIATGSFDRTVRIFNVQDRKSRDCYYNERMHIVHGVVYSNDGRFIISGSDDGSLRLWKGQASKKTGPVSRAERDATDYKEALKCKFKDVGEIARIARHRFLPKELKQASKQRHEMHEAQLRREARKEREMEESGAE